MAFASARWTKKKCIFAANDECGRRQVEDQTPVHLLVKVEIEVVERHLRIAKLRLFASPFQQSVAAASQFIGYQTGKEVDGGHRFCLGLLQAGVRRFVFSSTCAVYDEPEAVPITEGCRQWPTNPYGWSKLFLERLLAAHDSAYGMKFVALRYFKAAGATKKREKIMNRKCI
jgi:hypothetical protein